MGSLAETTPQESRPSQRGSGPKRVTRAAAAAACFGIVLTCVVFLYLRSGEQLYFQSQFQHSSEASSQLVKDRLESSLLMAVAIQGFLESQEPSTRESFAAFVTPLVGRCAEAKAVEWIPAVSDPERNAFELNWRRSSDPGFRIYERDQNGNDRAARGRPVYYPVLWAVPLRTNEKAIGFDLGSNPARLAALERARDTGRPSVTERIKLVQEVGADFGVLLALPVYRRGASTRTVEDRRASLRGFALVVFDANEIQETTTGHLAPTGLDSVLLDLSAPEESRELSFRHSQLQLRSPWKKWLFLGQPPRSLDKFPYGGRSWAVESLATDGYLERNYDVLYWLVLPAGIFLTLVVSRYLRLFLLQRHRLETAVAEQTASLRLHAAAFKAAANAIVITDASGNILSCNPAFTQLTGYAEGEVLGKNPSILKSGKQNPDMYQALWQTILSGGVWQGELVNKRKDGSLYTEEMTITPVRLDGGEITHFIAIKVDVTENRQALAELRASEERYRTLFEHNLAGVFRASPQKLIDCNDAMCRMLAYSRQEMGAIDLPSLFCDSAVRDAGVKQVLETGKLTNFEVDLRRKDGTVITALVNLNLLREESESSPIIAGALLDISEVRKLQEQLQQAQKLEAIGKLAGGIAHDFNNLLMIINSYGEIAMEKLEAQSPLRGPIGQVCNAAGRGAALTRQLLAFSRRQMMTPVPTRLDLVVSNLKEMLKRLIGEDIGLDVSSAEDLWWAKVDPSQFEQVVLNLAVNARDAMPHGGKLLLQTSNCVLEDAFVKAHPGSVAGQYVALKVSDTGCGMSREVQSRIFEPFYTTKGPGHGTGLGLSTVYGIVKQSAGYITVESEPDAGAIFWIYLPRSAEHAAAGTFEPLAIAVSRAVTVLLVEDESATKEAIADYLGHHGFRIIPASSAEEALRVAEDMRAGTIEVLLTDLVMPGMSGVELASRFQARHPKAKVLFMSGYTDEALWRTGMTLPEITVLSKPFRLADLASKLRGLLSTLGKD